MNIFLVAALGVGFISITVDCRAQICAHEETAKLVAGNGSAFDYFGEAVSVWNNTAVIGAHWDDTAGVDAGSAYIFQHDGTGWQEVTQLLANDAEDFDTFGRSVAILDDIVVISAVSEGTNGVNAGAVYVFRRTTSGWLQEAKLIASDGSASDFFGNDVAVSDSTILVGARGDDDNGSESGSCYVFRYSNNAWIEEAKLLDCEGSSYDRFGWSVALSGETALVGAPWKSDILSDIASGGCVVFRYDGNGWQQVSALTPGDGEFNDFFGYSVACQNDTALIGAYWDADNGYQSGAAYIFNFDGTGWVEGAKLKPSDGTSEDFFGRSVSLSGNTALIGAFGDDDNGSLSGSAYLFTKYGIDWVEGAKLVASDGAIDDEFGRKVALFDNTAVIAARKNDDIGSNSGSIYTFSLSCSPYCLADTNDDGMLTPADFTAWIAAFNASASECDQNADGLCTSADFTAWIANYNAGCP